MAQVDTHGTENTQARNTKSRAWVFTLNNYTDQDITEVKQNLTDCVDFVVGREVGTNGTPHLQGVMKWKNARHFAAVQKMFNSRAHWEQCKNWNASVNYCKKENNYICKNEEKTLEEQYDDYMHETYDGTTWHEWQNEILELIKTPPDSRTVNWYYETKGGVGKSFLCKYLDWKYDTVICNGKADNVFNCLKNYIDNEKKFPKIVIMDIPRSMQDYVSYQAIEKIKDGLLYSGKYEGGRVRLLPLHLIIFSNEEPKYSELSFDRWRVRMI